ncbi:hypothetical protein [Chelatococcus reniformis]|uniref:hypothetical protein n=1 Tax=Chelatococcus reniformis TaxID=1494448 RepID=UPI00166A6E3D|nr:hypothetical protein [Chelatococcus reniformis]
MRVLVLGTSNSLLRNGWVSGLREALPAAQIDNRSVGASPGVQFSCAMQVDFSTYDVVFLDSVVNDENSQKFIGPVEYINRVMYEIASTISSKTRLIILAFCKAVNLNTVSPSEVHITRETIARASGAQFVDIRSLVLKYGRSIHGDGDLYEHMGHPQSGIQKEFGRAIGECMNSVEYPMGTSNTPCFAHNFKVYTTDWLSQFGPITSKATSRFRAEFLNLRPGESIEFEEPGNCLGFYIDAKNTRSILRFDGPSGVRMKEYWFDLKPNSFELKFVPIKGGFMLNRISVCGRDLPFERSIQTRFANWPGTTNAQLSLSSIAFWAGRWKEPIPSMAGKHHLRLHETLEEILGHRF